MDRLYQTFKFTSLLSRRTATQTVQVSEASWIRQWKTKFQAILSIIYFALISPVIGNKVKIDFPFLSKLKYQISKLLGIILVEAVVNHRNLYVVIQKQGRDQLGQLGEHPPTNNMQPRIFELLLMTQCKKADKRQILYSLGSSERDT